MTKTEYHFKMMELQRKARDKGWSNGYVKAAVYKAKTLADFCVNAVHDNFETDEAVERAWYGYVIRVFKALTPALDKDFFS